MLALAQQLRQVLYVPKPSGTAHNPSIFAWQYGYAAAMEGKQLTDNPYYEIRDEVMHPNKNLYRWWNKGYQEGRKRK